MKRLVYTLLALALAAACHPDPVITNVEWTPAVDESALGDAPAPGSYKVTLTNIGTEEVVTGELVTAAPAPFSLVPGIYNVVIQAHGSFGGKAFNYIGSANSVSITGKEESYEPIKIAATASSALIFKEIHYNASKVLNGSAKGFLRTELGARIAIRKTPDLRFIPDDSVEKGIEMFKKLEQSEKRDATNED